jgi:hypothetical protein
MIKTLVLMPERDNGGAAYVPAVWQGLEARLAREFGGFSRRSEVIGVWHAAGRTYQDASREYTISLTSWRQLAAWLTIVDLARGEFQQEALYVEIAGVPEILSDVSA